MKHRRTVVLIAPAFVLVVAASLLASRLIVRAFNGPPAGCTPPNCSGAIGVNGQNNLSVGTSTPLSTTKLLLVASDTSASNYSLQVLQPAATPIFVVRNDGKIGIGTASPNYALDVNGTVNATTLQGAFTGTVSAGNISNDVFGANTGGGNYSFPASLGVATTSNASLPQSLSVYGGGYFGGNVGVGVTNPTAELTIGSTVGANNIQIGDNITSVNTCGGDWYTGIGIAFPTDIGGGCGDAAYIGYYADSGTENTHLVIAAKNDGGDSIDLMPSGGVGIGTANPSALLSVGSNSPFQVNSTGAVTVGTAAGQVFFTAHQEGSSYSYGTGMFLAQTDNPTGTSNYYYQGQTNGTTNFSVRADGQGYFAGNVGIGVTNPGYTLDVNGPIKTRSASGIIFSDGTSQGTTANWSGTANYLTKSDPTSGFAVKLGLSQVYDNGTNVGIGTTNPGSKLTVVGTIESTSGGIKFPDGSTQATAANSVNLHIGGWCLFDGSTASIIAGYNCSSITRSSTGYYEVHWINAFPNTNYGVTCTASNSRCERPTSGTYTNGVYIFTTQGGSTNSLQDDSLITVMAVY